MIIAVSCQVSRHGGNIQHESRRVHPQESGYHQGELAVCVQLPEGSKCCSLKRQRKHTDLVFSKFQGAKISHLGKRKGIFKRVPTGRGYVSFLGG